MRKHLNVPKKDRILGEAMLLVGIGTLITIGIIAALASYGYVNISLPR